MKIAQVAPLYESVPPRAYGGTERVVSYLTEALVEMGHEVTLFASGDSVTSANLVSVVPRGLRLDPGKPDPLVWHTIMLDQVLKAAPVIRRHPFPHRRASAATGRQLRDALPVRPRTAGWTCRT